ncbi:IS1595 family transposase [Microvirga sp. HBU67558]|uniref:IS1595 family transposase n=1 Tax=Microvirga TaxID=186650 RepID=UPI001B389CF2|nr:MULTISPECIES: IS1595 family transposase [unclassified Microvirga]MBQ0819465.1 IS1595 family transposase [Microvirga sp. HBU67558]
MDLSVREVLSRITTVPDMISAFHNESHCRRLLEAMVWPNGRVCPACGYRHSIALMGRENGKRARAGLYQCSNGTCRFQFTVTTRTPLHATKLPPRVWLSGLWLMLHSDNGISSIRLEEALGVSEPTAWRMDHALRLMVGREQALDDVVEIDGLDIGGKPRREKNYSPLGRGRKGEPKTLKTPALVAVQRPPDVGVGTPSREVRAAVIEDLSESEADRVLTETVDPKAHLMSDEWKAFVSIGTAFAAHDTVHHKAREYARGPVHINSAEGFNDRVRCTVSGVFHHIGPHHADLYFNEIGFRWSQRVVRGQAPRRTRNGRPVTKTLWARIPPALQLPAVFRFAVGREMRRTKAGGIDLLSKVAGFG